MPGPSRIREASPGASRFPPLLLVLLRIRMKEQAGGEQVCAQCCQGLWCPNSSLGFGDEEHEGPSLAPLLSPFTEECAANQGEIFCSPRASYSVYSLAVWFGIFNLRKELILPNLMV